MPSTGDSSNLQRSDSIKSFSTYHAEFESFREDANIHGLGPELNPQDFDDLQRDLAPEDSDLDFSDREWADKLKTWQRFANMHSGEDSLKAMHYALLPRSNIDLPHPHRWDMDLKWKTCVWTAKKQGFNYKPEYFVGLEPKILRS
jgi:hypothetical protein